VIDSKGVMAHRSVLTVDLGAIVANWQLLKSLAGDADCAAVVKADAYGLGAAKVAPALAAAGCRVFFVAHLAEAIELRAALPAGVIHVLNGFPQGQFAAYLDNDLRPVIGSRPELDEWLGEAFGVQGGGYALHVDTGMNRLGFSVRQALAMISDGVFDAAPPALVMSHFVSSEEPGDPLNRRQIEAFGVISSAFEARKADWRNEKFGLRQPKFSLSNSSGIFLKDNAFHHLIRPGFALYGGNPKPGFANPMKAVVRLDAPIIQIGEIEAGESVGYNAQWTAKRKSRIATLSLGYADGIFRNLSNKDGEPNRGMAHVHGALCPFAGRVSMDLITLDVTDAPEARAGAHATMLDETLTIDQMAEAAGTNGYNILTNLNARIARLYLEP
jgi:alanine racemase